MAHFKARKVDRCGSINNILETFGVPTKPEHLQHVKLPFEVHEQIRTKTKEQVFRGIEKILDMKYYFNTTETISWRTIFIHGNESLDKARNDSGKERVLNTYYANFVCMMKE